MRYFPWGCFVIVNLINGAYGYAVYRTILATFLWLIFVWAVMLISWWVAEQL